MGLLGGSVVKNPPANAGDAGLIFGSGRSPGDGNGNPLQYSCLGNPMNRGAWWAPVPGATKSRTGLSNWARAQWELSPRPLSASPSIAQTSTAGFLHCSFPTRNALPFMSTRPHFFLRVFMSLPKHPLIRDTSEPALLKQTPFLTLDMPFLAHITLCFSC